MGDLCLDVFLQRPIIDFSCPYPRPLMQALMKVLVFYNNMYNIIRQMQTLVGEWVRCKQYAAHTSGGVMQHVLRTAGAMSWRAFFSAAEFIMVMKYLSRR